MWFHGLGTCCFNRASHVHPSEILCTCSSFHPNRDSHKHLDPFNITTSLLAFSSFRVNMKMLMLTFFLNIKETDYHSYFIQWINIQSACLSGKCIWISLSLCPRGADFLVQVGQESSYIFVSFPFLELGLILSPTKAGFILSRKETHDWLLTSAWTQEESRSPQYHVCKP